MVRRRSQKPADPPKPQLTEDASQAGWPRLAPLLIVAAAVIAYANSFSGAFVFDDTYHIVNNPRITQLSPVTNVIAGARRPVVELSLAVNYALGGGLESSRGFHIFNLIVHILAAMTLTGVLRATLDRPVLSRLFGASARTWLPLIVALIWVVHPLQTQSVTYIIQRGESLMGLFYLLTLYCVIRGAESPHRMIWYAAAVASCALGMGAKAVMVTAPLVVLLFDRTFIGGSFRAALRRRWGLYVALFATWLVLVPTGVVRGVLGTSHARASVGFSCKDFTPFEYLLTQTGVLLHYLRLSIWPYPLCLDYEWPIARSIGEVIPAGAVIVVLLLVTAWGLWRKPVWGFVGAWFFIILGPTSSIVPIRDPVFEHRMYLPLAAVLVAIVLAGHALLVRLAPAGRVRQRIAAAMIVVVVLLFVVMTLKRNTAYASEMTMWADVVNQQPDNGRARYNLANALLKAGRISDAIPVSQEAIRLRPNHAPSYYDLGVALQRQKRTAEAMDAYRTAVRLDPDHASGHLNLGVLLRQSGDIEGAIAEYREALRVVPDHPRACYNLGNALMIQGREEEAVASYREAVRIDPGHVKARIKIAKSLVRRGLIEDAIREYQDALRVQPYHPDVHYNLGAALLEAGRVSEAVESFERTLQIQPSHKAAREALAAVRNQQ